MHQMYTPSGMHGGLATAVLPAKVPGKTLRDVAAGHQFSFCRLNLKALLQLHLLVFFRKFSERLDVSDATSNMMAQ